METILQLREAINNLDCANAANFSRTKETMLQLVDRVASSITIKPDTDTPHVKLSRREQEVMTMMLSGQRLKEIAARLDISVKTVTTHRSRLMKKLRVEDNLGLYRYGIRNGLIGV